ncbi:MAG: hypothetical protein AB8B91_02715 [Rubripirellula sp.]
MHLNIKYLLTAALLVGVFCSPSYAEDLLLEDYSGRGIFQMATWANSFEDPEGNQNSAKVEGKVAVVDWATKWSGLPSNGPAEDVSRYKTFQVDVMVEKGQPNEEGSHFYFQLLNETDAGYSYWELFVPQSKVPADGKWYRVRFPMSEMVTGFGDGGDAPTNFDSIIGTTCGMTFDEENKFKLKRARFDNVFLTIEKVDGIEVKPSPDTVNPIEK